LFKIESSYKKKRKKKEEEKKEKEKKKLHVLAIPLLFL
jgi:hypothetical protein